MGGVVVVAAAAEVAVDKKIIGNHYNPPHLLFQWHITHRCNLRCTHCYQESHQAPEPEFNDLLNILDQFHRFLDAPKASGGKPVRGHVTITGGEPFVRDDFPDLLEIFHNNRKKYSFAVLTNGTLIDDDTAGYLATLNPRFVQLSMDGDRNTHDQIRGTGNFDRTVAALERLIRAGVRTLVSFTAGKNNFHEFKSVAGLGRRLGVNRVWADRLVPIGSGADCRDLVLSPEDTRSFFNIMKKEQIKARLSFFRRTEVAMHRALQFLVSKNRPYHCTAGDTLLTVMPNGDLFPCRRMPVRVGNLFETPLSELYDHAPLLKRLRHQEEFDDQCQGCRFVKTCRGGLKCLSYAMTGDPFAGDPGCWIKGI